MEDIKKITLEQKIIELENESLVSEAEKKVIDESNNELRTANKNYENEILFLKAEIIRKDNTINMLCSKVARFEKLLEERNEMIYYNKVLLAKGGLSKN